jgi:hypothetical protein
MLQVYLDNIEDLLADRGKNKKKSKKASNEHDQTGSAGEAHKITLAEHSGSGLVEVEGAVSMPATSPSDVLDIFARGTRLFSAPGFSREDVSAHRRFILLQDREIGRQQQRN